MRLNKVIERFENGEFVYACGTIPVEEVNGIAAIGRSDYDMIMIETEHNGFSGQQIRNSLQALLDRADIVSRGSLQPRVVPFVRVPPNGSEPSEWIVKQALDAGAYGVAIPHCDSAEGAAAVVAAARFAQAIDSKCPEPPGRRGWKPDVACKYWGLDAVEYTKKADVWPIDPNGEIIVFGMVESMQCVDELPRIFGEVPGVGAIWVGPGDLSNSLGYRGQFRDNPVVEAQIDRVVDACLAADVPCGISMVGDDAAAIQSQIDARMDQGFRFAMVTPPRPYHNVSTSRRMKGKQTA